MIQLTMPQGSASSSAEHTALGISNGKSSEVPSIMTAKRKQLLDAQMQIKKSKRNDISTNNSTDVSKEYGINSKEVTLTRLATSPKSQNISSDKSPKKCAVSDTNEYDDMKRIQPVSSINNCGEDIPSECRDIIQSNEISIVKVSNKNSYSTRDKRQVEYEKIADMFSRKKDLETQSSNECESDYKRQVEFEKIPDILTHTKDSEAQSNNECENDFKRQVELGKVPDIFWRKKSAKMLSNNECDSDYKQEKVIEEDEVGNDSQLDNQQEETIVGFWNKQSTNNSRIFAATTCLYNGAKCNVSQNYSDYNDVTANQHSLPSEENLDTDTSTPLYYYNQDNQILNNENWDTYDASGNNHTIIQDHSNYSPDSAYGSMGDSEMSHFMLGFPNPPGENRCWLNATLHTLFATLFTLPINDDMQQLLQYEKCSKITQMLGDLHDLWRKGGSEKSKIYNIVKKFKENLSTLERTYCSDRQQDVSEFLMGLLNHLKGEFQKLLPKGLITRVQENITENLQVSPKTKNLSSGSKKSPFSKLRLRSSSPLRRIFSDTASSTVIDATDSDSTIKSNDSNICYDSKDNKEIMENPIDKFFLQKMVEDYECKECSKHRQMPIENLMVYADIPPETNDNSVDLTEAIEKIFAVEERNMICEYCKHNSHNMKTFYKEYPKVLIIQINRWRMSSDGTTNKICTPVSIPEKLSLSDFLLEQKDITKTYEPICIISHVGSNMDCGHYTSYIKHEDQWFHYNDMSVMPMTSKEALTAAQSTAYLLFYVDSDLLDKPNLDCYSSRCSPLHH